MDTVIESEGAATLAASAPLKGNKNNDHIIPSSGKIGNSIASKFLNLIAEGEEITFQTFDDTKERRDLSLVRVLHGKLEDHIKPLEALNQRRAGIFFTVNTTDSKGRTAQNITKIRAIFIDLDGAPLDPVLLAPLEPHIIVETSPNHFHAYWKVEGVPLEEFSMVQKALIERFSADPVVHDLPRVMRLPGFNHNKGIPTLVKVIQTSGTSSYKYSDFLEAFQIDRSSTGKSNNPKLGPSNDPILQELEKRSLIQRPMPNKPGGWEITCPFSNLHTTGEKGTAYFEAHTNGYKGAGFKCQHVHCEGKTVDDLKVFLGMGQKNEKEEWGVPIPLKEELLPVAPFLPEMLPEGLRPWIMDNAERMQGPPDFLAGSCVVVLGSLIGRKIGVLPKAYDDWLVIPNLWGMVVGRPSLLKSPAITEMMKPLEELAKKAICQHREDEQQYKQEEMWLEAKQLALKGKMREAAKQEKNSRMPECVPLESISKPTLRRYKTEDSTVEKIGEILLGNPQGILVHRDELVGWLKTLDKQGHEGNRAFFLESWNGNGPYTVDRITRGTLHIPALCLSIIGGIQPGPLAFYVHQAASGGGGDDGLLQRFQLLMWPDAPTTWENIDRVPDLEAKKKALEVFYNIDAFEPFEPSVNQDLKTYSLRFSPEAQEIFDIWRNSLESNLRSGNLSPSLESHLAKYRSLMPSLALIFYLIETIGRNFTPTAIDVLSARQAIKWCDYLETHAKRLYSSGEDPSMESARALLKKIKNGDLPSEFSPRDVYHATHWAKLANAEQVNNAIDILEEFQHVKVESIKEKGVRPSRKVIVNPLIKEKL